MHVVNQDKELELGKMSEEKEDVNGGKVAYSKGPYEESDQVFVALPTTGGTADLIAGMGRTESMLPAGLMAI